MEEYDNFLVILISKILSLQLFLTFTKMYWKKAFIFSCTDGKDGKDVSMLLEQFVEY